MLQYSNNGFLLQSVEEIQQLPYSCFNLFGDFETSSRDPKKNSLNPWHDCWPIGFAFTVDYDPKSYFVPWELIRQDTTNWLWKLLNSATNWINHHVKYDAHVLLRHTGWELPEKLNLICTIALARLIDADRSYKGGYDLETLSWQWLHHDIKPYGEKLKRYTHRNGKQFNQDYGKIPLDILGEYACGDVIANRMLYNFELQHLPPECYDTSGGTPALVETEIRLTKDLVQVERNGLHITPEKVYKEYVKSLTIMVNLEDEMQRMLGYAVNPDSPKQLFDLICNRFGQPVLKWTNTDKDGKETEKSNPSFDAKTLKAYRQSLDTPEVLRNVIKKIITWKKESQQVKLYYRPWQTLHTNGVLHASFQQNVRSGRMACREPNDQQFDGRAKALIEPKRNYVMLAHDYSQVEYRVIVHYLQNQKAIAAYANDPDTDYHVWVSILCHIDRKPAKTMNFLMAFGGGKRKAIATLAANFLEAGVEMTHAELLALGEHIYNTYHANLPELKATSQRAQDAARNKGYVRNLAGRRLHLPGLYFNQWFSKKDNKLIDKCHIALNRAVQSSASDIAKERAVAIVREPWFIEYGLQLIALVHDAFYFQMPDRPDCEVVEINNRIRAFLEDTPFKMSVPLRVDSGYSRKNMKDCDAPAYCDIKTRQGGGSHTRVNYWAAV
jgi:DNA polymerase I-like protein with 3'-5' exonuclease and polymerase domains